MPSTEPVPAAVLRSLVDAVDAALWAGDSPTPSSPRLVPASGAAGALESSDAGRGGEGRPGAVLLRVTGDDGGHAGPAEPGPGGPQGSPDGGSGKLGILSLGGGHPLDALLGLVAPPTWAALGVSAHGDVRVLDGDQPPERVHVTMLLARSGASAGVLRRDGRPPSRLDEPPQGAVADACRRALALPTAPPAGSTAMLWTRWWLDRLVQAATERATPGPIPGWAEAVALHPIAFVPLPRGPAPTAGTTVAARRPSSRPADGARSALALAAPAPEPPAVVAATQALADAWTWARLRAEPSVVADLSEPPVSRGVARWMDDGMFARWLVSALPPAGTLLDACRALLPDGVASRVAAVATACLAEPEDDR